MSKTRLGLTQASSFRILRSKRMELQDSFDRNVIELSRLAVYVIKDTRGYWHSHYPLVLVPILSRIFLASVLPWFFSIPSHSGYQFQISSSQIEQEDISLLCKTCIYIHSSEKWNQETSVYCL